MKNKSDQTLASKILQPLLVVLQKRQRTVKFSWCIQILKTNQNLYVLCLRPQSRAFFCAKFDFVLGQDVFLEYRHAKHIRIIFSGDYP
jgi:hypothetical protein